MSSSWLLDSESGLYVENVGLTDTRLVSKQGENSFVSVSSSILSGTLQSMNTSG